MCMALPRGNRQGPPTTFVQRIRQWGGFGILVVRFTITGLLGWFRHRLNSGAT